MTAKQILILIPTRYRHSLGMMFVLMLVAMFMETLSIGLIVPFISLLTNPELLRSENFLISLFPQIVTMSEMHLVIYGLLLLIGVYFIKTAFLSYYYWQQNAFSFSLCVSLTEELYLGYLRSPWDFHIENNSAYLLRNISYEVNIFINNIVINGLKLASETLTIIGIGVLLLVVEPLGTLTLSLVVTCFGFAYQKLAKTRLTYWGEKRLTHEGKKLMHLQQGLGAIKEIKLLGREPGFLAMFRPHNLESAKSVQYKLFLQQLPRLFLEVITVSGVTLLVGILLWRGETIASLLQLLGLFAAVVFRLMPSVNRIIDALQNIHYGQQSVEVINSQLDFVRKQAVRENITPLPFCNQLEFKDVSYRYPSAQSPVIKSMNLTVRKGEVVGLIGTSGAGKTTLVDLLLGLLTPENGTILCDGLDIQSNLRGWQANLGYVQQTISLLDDSLLKNIVFGTAETVIDMGKVNQAVKAAQLDTLIDSLPDGLQTNIGERGVKLSGGQRQRIGIARALYRDPQILVLDEATSALDHETEERIMEAIYALGNSKTLIIIAHRLTTVARCERLYRVEEGHVVPTESGELSIVH
jgi:ABC-type multidrug transport system fused ATPase/permease subunit